MTLSLFFNIERLDINQDNEINLQSFIYLLVTIAVISILIIPTFSKVRVVWATGLWMFAYLIIKIFLLGNGRLFGGINTYLTITEAFFVVVITALTHRLAREVNIFRRSVEQVTLLMSGQSLKDIELASDEIQREMTRSRHYSRPMSVIVADLKGQNFKSKIDNTITEIQNETAVQYARAKIAQDIQRQLRLMDIVLFDKQNQQFIIVCPEVNVEGIRPVITKINNQMHNIGLNVKFGSATFPDEGLTFTSLMDQAQQKMNYSHIDS